MKRVIVSCTLPLALISAGCLMLTTQDDRHACNNDDDCATDSWCRGVAQVEDADCEDPAKDNETGLPHVKLLDSCFYFYCVDQGTIQCGDQLSCAVSKKVCIIRKEEVFEDPEPHERASLQCAARAEYPAEGWECPGSDLFTACHGDPDRPCVFRPEQMTAERDNWESSFRCPPQ